MISSKPALHLFILSSSLLALGACKEGSKTATAESTPPAKQDSLPTTQASVPSQTPAQPEKIVEATAETVGAFGYEFNQSDSTGACTTGVQNYDSLHQLCLGLQDDERNHNCAGMARINEFMSRCGGLGYAFMDESRSCDVKVVKKGAVVDFYEPNNPKDVVAQHTVCMGRTYAGPAIGFISSETRLHGDLDLKADGVFVSAADTTRDHKTSISIDVLQRKKNSVLTKSVLDKPFEFDGILKGADVTLKDGRRLLITCSTVAACDKLPKK